MADGHLNAEDAVAVVSLLTGLDKKDQQALQATAEEVGDVVKRFGSIPKPPTGPGTVPKADRDPKRFFSPSDRQNKRTEQGHECGTGCGTKIDSSNSAGHHIQRHSDGGKTVPENNVEVCIECHKKLHSSD